MEAFFRAERFDKKRRTDRRRPTEERRISCRGGRGPEVEQPAAVAVLARADVGRGGAQRARDDHPVGGARGPLLASGSRRAAQGERLRRGGVI